MARIMEIDPGTIPYLAGASGQLGPIAERHIQQRGELLATVAQRFAHHVSWDRTRGAKTPEGLR
jgi:hypothetical protein